MLPRIEEKFQGWRALAVLADGGERLLCVGHSNAQVRAGYEAGLAERLGIAERARVSRIALECWEGLADRGRWVARSALPLPASKPAARRAAAPAKNKPPDAGRARRRPPPAVPR
jgi:hypothetical protein